MMMPATIDAWMDPCMGLVDWAKWLDLGLLHGAVFLGHINIPSLGLSLLTSFVYTAVFFHGCIYYTDSFFLFFWKVFLFILIVTIPREKIIFSYMDKFKFQQLKGLWHVQFITIFSGMVSLRQYLLLSRFTKFQSLLYMCESVTHFLNTFGHICLNYFFFPSPIRLLSPFFLHWLRNSFKLNASKVG